MTEFWRWVAQRISPFIDTTVHNRLITLEKKMADLATVLSELDAATNEIATELEDLRNEVAQHDTALADALTEKVIRLRALAKDPESPIEPGPGSEPTA